MIFVTLGTQDKSFDRLLKRIDKEISNGNIKDKVIVQAGNTKYKSKNMEIFDFLPRKKMDSYYKECDLLITHGGVGSILDGLKNNKIVIATPRLKKHNEHVNDHQLEIINEFSNKGYIIPLLKLEDLNEVLDRTKTFTKKKYISNTNNFVKMIESFID